MKANFMGLPQHSGSYQTRVMGATPITERSGDFYKHIT